MMAFLIGFVVNTGFFVSKAHIRKVLWLDRTKLWLKFLKVQQKVQVGRC